MKLIHKGLILISLPLVFEIFFAIRFVDLLHQSKRHIDREVRAKEITRRVEKIQALLAESTTIAGISRVYKNKDYAERFDADWKEIATNFRALKKLPDKRQERAIIPDIAELLGMSRYGQDFLAYSSAAEHYQNLSAPGFNIDIPSWLLIWRNEQSAYSPFQRLLQLETATINAGPALRARIVEQLQNFLVIGILGNLVIVLGLAIFFGQSIAKRLTNLMKNTVLLRKKKSLLPPLGGSDEIAELDSALHKAASKILEIERFKQQLIGIVSHEIKAPLSAVHSLLTMLSSRIYGEIPPAATTIIAQAEADSQSLMRLVMNLLNLEKMESGKAKLKSGAIALDTIIEKAISLVENLADSRAITIMSKSCYGTVRADSEQLTQVVLNLLSSAITRADKDSLVTIEAEHQDNSLNLSIKYTGKQIDHTQNNAISGFALCESILELYGGTISSLSSAEADNLFFVQIPNSDDQQKNSAQKNSEQKSPYQSTPLSAKPQKWGIWRKGLLLICLPFFFELIFMSALSFLLLQARQESRQQEQSREIVAVTQQINKTSLNSLLFMAVDIGYRDKRIAEAYNGELLELQSSLSKLGTLTADNTERQQLTIEITRAAEQLISEYTQARSKTKSTSSTLSSLAVGPESADKLFNRRRLLSDKLDNLTAHETVMRSQFEKEAASITRNLNQVMLIGLSVNLLIAVGLTILLVTGITRRIGQVMVNAKRLSSKTDLLPAMEPTDEIGELDIAFHETAEVLRRQKEEKERLLSIVSGELKTPLLNIQTGLHLLQTGSAGSLSDKALEKVVLAERGTSRLIELIGDFMDIETIESGKFTLNLSEQPVSNLVSRAIDYLQITAQKKGITIELNVDNSLAYGDAERLIQVMINLISNALKFSPAGKRVFINCSTKEDQLLFSVCDQGAGVPKALQEKIFERFQQNTNDQALNPEGTGLGLSISKALIEQHNGKIGVSSEEGLGSTFWFSIPVAKRTDS